MNTTNTTSPVIIPTRIKGYLHEWAEDFSYGDRATGTKMHAPLIANLDAYSNASVPVIFPTDFLFHLLGIASGHIATDLSVFPKKHHKRLKELQQESKEIAKWISKMLNIPSIKTFDDQGNAIQVV